VRRASAVSTLTGRPKRGADLLDPLEPVARGGVLLEERVPAAGVLGGLEEPPHEA
jgi:hypothetical protein